MQTNSFALVFIHGHGVDASIWDGIYADLVSGAPVIKSDFSRSTTHTTVEAYAEELYAQLQVVQADKVVLIGHSMGGWLHRAGFCGSASGTGAGTGSLSFDGYCRRQ